jgi:hypothetical protein
MKIEEAIQEVETIRDAMSSIIAAGSQHVISGVLADLREQKKKCDALPRRAARPPWTVTIKPTQPLLFVGTDDEVAVKHNLEVDLACSISQPDKSGIAMGEHNIAVRVWSKDGATYFRDALDAASLRDSLDAQKKRVMLRFHFDLCNKDQEGPKHHLQIGGKGQPSEYAWLPENWKLPRFAHFPVNLALVCEFVGRTFFPKAFQRIAEEPTWKNAIMTAERAYLLPFLTAIPYVSVDAKRHKATFLSWVWNG